MVIKYPGLCVSYATNHAIFPGTLFVSKPAFLPAQSSFEAIVNSLLLQDEPGNFDVII